LTYKNNLCPVFQRPK